MSPAHICSTFVDVRNSGRWELWKCWRSAIYCAVATSSVHQGRETRVGTSPAVQISQKFTWALSIRGAWWEKKTRWSRRVSFFQFSRSLEPSSCRAIQILFRAIFFSCSQVRTPFSRSPEDDERETKPSLRAVRLSGATRVLVSKKAIALLYESFTKSLRTCAQALGSAAAYVPMEQTVKSICSTIARVEPAEVRCEERPRLPP